MPVTYTNNSILSADGWNLVGNPYPCEIDWNEASWTKTNINPSITIFDPGTYVSNGSSTSLTGTYYSYSEGAGCPPSRPVNCNVIASMQAFFVQATGTNPVLAITESAKVNTGTNHRGYFRQEYTGPQNVLWLQVRSGNLLDETAVKFSSAFSGAYERSTDLAKMSNPNLNMASLSSDSVKLAINYYSALDTAAKLIPLSVATNKPGDYSISFASLETFEKPVQFKLIDTQSNTSTEITAGAFYPFSIANGDKSAKGRFFLSAKLAAEATVVPVVKLNLINNTSVLIYKSVTGTNTISKISTLNQVPVVASQVNSFIVPSLGIKVTNGHIDANTQIELNNELSDVISSSFIADSSGSGYNYLFLTIVGVSNANIDEIVQNETVATGTAGEQLANFVSVYPNPIVDDVVHIIAAGINEESVSITVENTSGIVVTGKRLLLTAKGNAASTLLLNNQSSGIYFIKVKGKTFAKTLKLIKY